MSTQQSDSEPAGEVRPTGELVNDETAASAAQAAANANLDMADYPQTSGDLDPSQPGTPRDSGTTGDEDLDQAMQTVEGVRAYLADDTTPEEQARRADAVEAAENARDGANRKGVMDAVASARDQ